MAEQIISDRTERAPAAFDGTELIHILPTSEGVSYKSKVGTVAALNTGAASDEVPTNADRDERANTFSGDNNFTGALQKSGDAVLTTTSDLAAAKITGDIAAARITDAMNAGGSAPIYACRAWVNFRGTGTVAIRASGNVSSITDNGTGNYTVNFTTAMVDSDYSVVFGMSRDLNGSVYGYPTVGYNFTSSDVRVATRDSAGEGIDHEQIPLAIFR